MAGNDFISAFMRGQKEFDAVTKEIEANVHKATVAAIRANQAKLKSAIRANIKDEPRWTQHGKNKVTGANFQVGSTTGQHNHPRSGGPGRMTGRLYKGVVGKKKIRMENGTHTGIVGIVGMDNNVKKRVFEAKFPYFRPAVEKVLPTMAALFDKGWEKAIHKMGGRVL